MKHVFAGADKVEQTRLQDFFDPVLILSDLLTFLASGFTVKTNAVRLSDTDAW